jgi:hypothetical protein
MLNRKTVNGQGREVVWTRHGDQGWDFEYEDEIEARHAHHADDEGSQVACQCASYWGEPCGRTVVLSEAVWCHWGTNLRVHPACQWDAEDEESELFIQKHKSCRGCRECADR